MKTRGKMIKSTKRTESVTITQRVTKKNIFDIRNCRMGETDCGTFPVPKEIYPNVKHKYDYANVNFIPQLYLEFRPEYANIYSHLRRFYDRACLLALSILMQSTNMTER